MLRRHHSTNHRNDTAGVPYLFLNKSDALDPKAAFRSAIAFSNAAIGNRATWGLSFFHNGIFRHLFHS